MADNKPDENVSKDEQIGFHKGALSTLAKERQELARMLNIVEQLMQMHIGALKDLGVDLQAQAEELGTGVTSNGKTEKKEPKKPIEDIL